MYLEDEFMDNEQLSAVVDISYTKTLIDEDNDEYEEEGIITVSTKDLELTESINEGERGMGPEVRHIYTGSVETEEGIELDVEVEVWEYPSGVINETSGNVV